MGLFKRTKGKLDPQEEEAASSSASQNTNKPSLPKDSRVIATPKYELPKDAPLAPLGSENNDPSGVATKSLEESPLISKANDFSMYDLAGQEEPPEDYFTSVDTAFSPTDDEDLFQTWQENKKKQEELYKDVPAIEVVNNRIQDVLELQQIPATYSLEKHVLFPEDVNGFTFDMQAPMGYEPGAVDAFKRQVFTTLQWYVARLEERNGHVATLATIIDRLQVDANNLKYQSEIAAGINVMPTNDQDHLEKELYEAKIELGKLRQQVKETTGSTFKTTLTPRDKKLLEELKDEVTLLRREKEAAEEEAQEAKNQVILLEDQLLSLKENIDQEAAHGLRPQKTDAPASSTSTLPGLPELPALPEIEEAYFSPQKDAFVLPPEDEVIDSLDRRPQDLLPKSKASEVLELPALDEEASPEGNITYLAEEPSWLEGLPEVKAILPELEKYELPPLNRPEQA